MATNNSSDYGPTQYNVQVGGANGTLSSVAPSATSGIPLVSGGSSANPSFTTAVVAGGGTGNTSATAYAVLCGGTSSTAAHQSVASVGSAGQILASNGAGALPTFQNAAGLGASWVLLHTLTASNSASLAFTSTYITTTYQVYMVVFQGLLAAQANNEVTLNWSTDNGSTYINSNIASGINASLYNSATLSNNNSATKVLIGETVGTTFGLNGYALLYNLAGQGASVPIMQSFTSQANQNVFGSAYMTSTTPNVNNIKLTFSAGNIASGTMSLYGLAQ